MRATAIAIATKPQSSDRKLDRAILQVTQPPIQTTPNQTLSPQLNPMPRTPTTMGRLITPIALNPTQKHGLSRRHPPTPNPINPPPLHKRIIRPLRTITRSPAIVPSITNPLNPNPRHPPPKHRRNPLRSQRPTAHNTRLRLHRPSKVLNLSLPELRRLSLRPHLPCQTHRLPHLVSI